MPLRKLEIPSPAGAQPLDGEMYVWRYMPFVRFLSILKGELYFCKISRLHAGNDPMESAPVARGEDVAAAITRLSGDAHDKWIAEMLAFSPPWLRELWQTKLPANQRTQCIANAFDIYSKNGRAVSCWYSGNFESAGMWQAFARDGVAIKIRLKWLMNGLENQERAFAVSAVHYLPRTGEPPLPFGSSEKYPDLVCRPYLVKGKEFEHEKEIRFITQCHSETDGFNVSLPSLCDAIDKIYISPYVDQHAAVAFKQHLDEIGKNTWGRYVLDKVEFSSISVPTYYNIQLDRVLSDAYERQARYCIPP